MLDEIIHSSNNPITPNFNVQSLKYIQYIVIVPLKC